jgi:hypothetical protein
VDEITSAAHFNGSEFTLGPQGSARPFYTVGNQQSVVLLPRTVRLDKRKSEQDWIVKKTGAMPDTEARLKAIIAAEFVSNWFKKEKRKWEFDLIRRIAELYGGRIKTRFRDATVHYQPFYEVRADGTDRNDDHRHTERAADKKSGIAPPMAADQGRIID